MSTEPKTFITPEEYLERERKAEYKSEYYNGEIIAMPTVNVRHDRINRQLYTIIDSHLRETKWEWFTAAMRVLAEPVGLYTYPDLSIVCGEARFADEHEDTLINPTLLFEIYSPETEDNDRGGKSYDYRKMPSLQELLIIGQDRYAVDFYRRKGERTWSVWDIVGLDASIELESIGYTLRLSELYERVTG